LEEGVESASSDIKLKNLGLWSKCKAIDAIILRLEKITRHDGRQSSFRDSARNSAGSDLGKKCPVTGLYGYTVIRLGTHISIYTYTEDLDSDLDLQSRERAQQEIFSAALLCLMCLIKLYVLAIALI